MNYKLIEETDLQGKEKNDTGCVGEKCDIVGTFTLDDNLKLKFKSSTIKTSVIRAITESNCQVVVQTENSIYTLEKKTEDK